MPNFQNSINRTIGTIGVASRIYAHSKQAAAEAQSTNKAANVQGVKQPSGMSPQAAAASQAEENMQNEIEAKKVQREQINALSTNLGGKVEDLPEAIRNKIYEELDK